MSGPFSGVLVPVLTPFDPSLAPDTGRFVDYCERLLSHGADGLALFGTTSEANSMSAGERMGLLDALVRHGIPGERLMPGIGSCSVTETTQLLSHATESGAAGALMLPPFFYKGAAATDDGLFDFVARVMEQTEGSSTKVYLYHIPPVAVLGWSVSLVRRVIEAFPDRIVGLKDSSGDWSNTRQLIESFPGFDIFPGSEVFLLDGLRAGAVGCITATGNLNLKGIRAVYANWESESAEELQSRATNIRMAIQNAGIPIAVMKAYLAAQSGSESWAQVRPPLESVDQKTIRELESELRSMGFQYDLF